MKFIKISNKKHLFDYNAIVIYPFCFYKSELLDSTKRHELIHERQILELFILGFYVWYLTEFIIKFFYYWNYKKAYLSISFEREAYKFAYHKHYFCTRKPYEFLKYIFKNDTRYKDF